MTKIFDEYLTRVVNEYSGPKLAIIVAGGGSGIARLCVIPGVSKVLYSMVCPYDTAATIKLIEQNGGVCRYFKHKAVSPEASWELARCWEVRGGKEVVVIGITGAITTSRYRRGNNEAFISIGRGEINAQYHIKLGKLPESIYEDHIIPWREGVIFRTREKEDELIAMTALNLATGISLPLEIQKEGNSL